MAEPSPLDDALTATALRLAALEREKEVLEGAAAKWKDEAAFYRRCLARALVKLDAARLCLQEHEVEYGDDGEALEGGE